MFKKKNNEKPKTRGLFSLERHVSVAYVFVCHQIFKMIAYNEHLSYKKVAEDIGLKEKILFEGLKKGEIIPSQLISIMDMMDVLLEEKYSELEKKESEVKDA